MRIGRASGRMSDMAAMAAMSALAACGRDVHDVAWYRAHAAERAARMASCRNDQGRVAATPDCISALAADSEADTRRFWTVAKPAPRVHGNSL